MRISDWSSDVCSSICHRHPVAHRWTLRRQLLDQWRKRQVEKQHLVFGVIDDPRDLLGEQPRIDRVKHIAAAGDRVVQLEMPIAVPGQRRHRSEEHTSELQSLMRISYAVFCLKKKKKLKKFQRTNTHYHRDMSRVRSKPANRSDTNV